MPIGVYTRAVGIRLAVLSSAHIKAGNLDQGLDLGERAVDVLSRVNSPRAHDYVRQVNHALQPWRREGRVREFVRQSTAGLTAA
jgi:hypothetical protein